MAIGIWRLTEHINIFICRSVMFIRRLGNALAGGALTCAGGHNCPQILEMETGDFAVIGTDITADSVGFLPAGSGCGPGERVVRLPRQVLVAAIEDIPKRQ